MPPTGTSQSPVPLPITWYSKHRFCRSESSPARANVPISASVRTTPRTVSWPNSRSITAASGCSNSASQASSSPASARNSARVRSGSVSVGNTRRASAAVRA
jgi:hypothetical protein